MRQEGIIDVEENKKNELSKILEKATKIIALNIFHMPKSRCYKCGQLGYMEENMQVSLTTKRN
ncbi:hypothetical protein CR513_41234, partial [Mucuna pruriens]